LLKNQATNMPVCRVHFLWQLHGGEMAADSARKTPDSAAIFNESRKWFVPAYGHAGPLDM
jgi:hypothetical protein